MVMIGDVLLISEQHTRIAHEMATIINNMIEDRLVVAIAGESGSGKSEIAHELGKKLKALALPAKILHGDNYYRVPPTQRTEWRRRHGLESVGDKEYDWETFERNISEFRRGAKAALPFLDLYSDQKDTLLTDFSNIRVLILEGLYCLKASADLRFFIELTYKDTEKVRVRRGKEAQTEFRLLVLKRESEVVQSHKRFADYLITKEFKIIKNKNSAV